MGCNCKKVEKVGKNHKELLKHAYEKKGIKKMLSIFTIQTQKYCVIITSILLFILFLPFLVCNVIYTSFTKGNAYVTLPFSKNKKIKTENHG